MKRFLLITIACILGAIGCGTSDRNDSKGRSYDIDGINVIELEGSWLQMGRQYGILEKEQLNEVLDYLDNKLGSGSEKMDAALMIADYLYANYPEHLKEFFDGVAGTSGLSLERVKLCNAVEYVEGIFQCSAMAAWGEYGSGKLVFGRNYDADSYREIEKDLVVTVYHPDDGIAAATVGYAGEVYCVNGFNENGIFIEFNNGMPSAGEEIDWSLCPSTTSLFNLLFTATNLDDVDSFFKNTASALAATIGVADKHEARSYEWCADGVKRGDEMTDDGLMISTNHYLNDGWSFSVPDDENSWNSITRYRNLSLKAQENKGLIDVGKMKEIISATLEEGGPMHSLTRYQIVAVPEDMTLHIKTISNDEWAELDMKQYF